ncbi:HAUS augmin-like complex subunit 7 isoform X1 [Syngnathus typhle]|uniref:HAUS augmin-like complex subunit 7 isoform X1 n=1 Tax=Syngnathus typhle TaxID=161592 RepID=UPI002A6A384A|nr:HAUS augmin-like complex subunit 7 isoform X1 [Syngnathus typhle]
MAAVSNVTEQARRIYSRLLAMPCPLLECVYIEESEDMLQLLCTPSQLRTDILTWVCCSIDPNLASLKENALRTRNPDILTNGMAALGQDLMLCRGDSLDLIKGDAGCHQQLQFLENLIAEVSDLSASTAHDMKILLDTVFTDENLAQIVTPSLDPCFSNVPYVALFLQNLLLEHFPSFVCFPSICISIRRVLCKSAKSTKPRRDNAESSAALIKSTRSMLEQLKSECEFLTTKEEPNARASACRALHVAMCDLQQLMTTFCHVEETHLRVFCTKERPRFSADPQVFQRVHELLQAFSTELEMLNEVSEASTAAKQFVSHLQTKRCCTSQGEGTIYDQLDKLTERYNASLSHLSAAKNT